MTLTYFTNMPRPARVPTPEAQSTFRLLKKELNDISGLLTN